MSFINTEFNVCLYTHAFLQSICENAFGIAQGALVLVIFLIPTPQTLGLSGHFISFLKNQFSLRKYSVWE